MDLVKQLSYLEDRSSLHEVRLLILLYVFSGPGGTDRIEGLTKLAKLDFLLRYPTLLERALMHRGHSGKKVAVQEHERTSVESQMVRYRFGPWDHRYREYVNLLVARGLAAQSNEGRTITVGITDRGRQVAGGLTDSDEFGAYVGRAEILYRNFNMTATNLMRFIYRQFPEIISLRSNSPIPV
jgi:hypothetical protein